jgi:hypothetical protein
MENKSEKITNSPKHIKLFAEVQSEQDEMVTVIQSLLQMVPKSVPLDYADTVEKARAIVRKHQGV